MTYTEQYNQYVQDWIKENPAFSGPYEDYYLEFDEWIDKYIIEFAEWIRKETYYEHLTKEFIYKRNIYESEKNLLQIYKKEKNL
jgi:hypothetical protein